MTPPADAAAVAMRGIAKRYPGVRALAGVDFELRAGEIHALVGENGAGKSTLIRILTGVERADAGAMTCAGRPYAPRAPRDAERSGIATIHQEVQLVPALSLAENLFLGREPRRWWGIDARAIRERARAELAELGLDVDVARPAREFPLAVQQLLLCARALALTPRVLVLDEPTSSLERREVDELFARLRALRERGLGLLFVAHSLAQVFALADRITVLRAGERVGTFDARTLTERELIGHMLGRALPPARRAAERPAGAQRSGPWLRARGWTRARAIRPFDLDLAPGEVVGLAGLLGSGRSELVRALFGAEPATGGALEIDGRPAEIRSPAQAVRHGLAFSPEDRKSEGLLPHLSVAENIALVARRRRGRFGVVSVRAERELAQRWIEALRIAARPEQPAGTLSGGNQQKVILARWLAAGPRLLILDEPTRGIDVGAKREVEERVAELASGGLAVLFVSSALEEVARVSTRVLALRDRAVAGELDGPLDEARIVALVAGGGEHAP